MTGGLTLVGGVATSSGYVLLSANGSYVVGGSSPVTLTPGTLFNTTNATISGNSADAGLPPATLTVFRTIATLTGTNSYTGGTIVDGGTLTTGSANLPTNGAVSLIDSNATGTPGVLIFNQPAAGTYGGVISGTGCVTKDNTGTLTLTGINTYTGATTVNAGTLQIGDGTTDGSIAASSAITNNAAVVFNLVSDQTIAQVISGTGPLTKTGAGTLTLTGANTYTGGTFINAGALALQGGSMGTTTVASNAFLRGNGSVNGNLINNGTVSPGFSPGVILVAGNFTQGAGGTLVMEFASAISFDQLLIGGTANLDGTLQLDILGGFNPAGQSFTLLTATGGVSGAFTAITGSAAVTANVTHNPNNVTVSFTQTAFTSFALTPNQTAVAAAAQNVPALTAALNLVPLASQMPAALNALSPQGYEIWSDLAFAHARSLADRLGQDRGAIVGHDNYYFEVG